MNKLPVPLNADLGLLFIRAMVGFVFVFHGSQKLFGAFGGGGIDGMTGYLESLGVPLPGLNAWLAAGAEFFGGLALMAGIATRLATLPLIVTMAVAAFVAHAGSFSLQNGGMEYALTLGVVLVGLFFTGPGALSIDARMGRRDS